MMHAKTLAPFLLLAAAACSSGGGSDGTSGPPITLQFATADSNAPESGPAVNVAVRLVLLDGPLASEVSVQVRDAGTGTGSGGSDYVVFAPQTVVFGPGAVSGEVQTVAVTPLADSLAEGPETLALELFEVSGAALGAVSAHTVTLIDADPAVVQFAEAASATFDEADAVETLTVELVLDPGVTLDVDISVDALDSGAGTATSGADYDPIVTQTLTFPRFTPGGTAVDVAVQVRDDAELEGDESVVLALLDPSAAVSLTGHSTHALTITDDEESTEPFLSVTKGEGGGESAVAHGDTLDLGSQTVGADPGPGETVTLANLGALPMALDAPALVGGDVADFAIEFTGAPEASPEPPRAIASPLIAVAEDPRRGFELALDPLALAELAGRGQVVRTEVPVPGGNPVALALTRLPSPWSPDSVLALNGVQVEGGPAAIVPDLSLWRGEVEGVPGSSVFLAFSSHGSRGWVRFSHEPGAELQLVVDSAGTARIAWADQLPQAGAVAPDTVCAEVLLPPGADFPGAVHTTETPDVSDLSVPNARLAIETDYQLFQKLGSTPATTAYVTELVAAISDRYRSDAQTTLSIAYLGVWDTPGDPWTTPDVSGSTLDMIEEFRAAWAPLEGGSWPVSADLAHFVSGANLGGGIAYLNVLCNENFGFGVSADINGNIDWDTFDGSPAGFNWDFVVLAHELGHNFSAQHTHDYCPPLDECAAPAYWGPCQDERACIGDGTLMSYCHTCAGGIANIRLEFHPFIANRIRSAVNGSCLGQSSLAGGETAPYRVRFAPVSGAGPKTTTLRFGHDATNAPSPFEIQLAGEALP